MIYSENPVTRTECSFLRVAGGSYGCTTAQHSRRPCGPYKGSCYRELLHTSALSGRQAKDKRVVIVAGGEATSIVEALEFAAAEDAAKLFILAKASFLPLYILSGI